MGGCFFFVLSLASLESTFGVYNISILHYINLQEAIIFVLSSFLTIESLAFYSFLALFFYVPPEDEAYLNIDSSKIILGIFAIAFSYLINELNKIVEIDFLRNLINGFSNLGSLMVFMVFFYFLFKRSKGLNNSIEITKYIIVIVPFFTFMVFSNVLGIEKLKKEQYIIRLENQEIVTGFGKYVIYNSLSVIIIHDGIEKTNTVIQQSEVKSFVDCNYKIPN